MTLSRQEIMDACKWDTRPSSSGGASNADRYEFICEVFELDDVDLEQAYDWQVVTKSKCVVAVTAAKEMMLLKLDFINRLFEHGHLTRLEWDMISSPWIIAVQRINWHLHHLELEMPTPPFEAIH